MTKADIVNEISMKTDINKRLVLKSVEAFMEVIKDSLADGDNVYLRGFGSLVIKKRAEKTARNIKKKLQLLFRLTIFRTSDLQKNFLLWLNNIQFYLVHFNFLKQKKRRFNSLFVA